LAAKRQHLGLKLGLFVRLVTITSTRMRITE